MQRYITKVKTLFSQPGYLTKRMFHSSNVRFTPNDVWQNMSELDRINSALNDSQPETAEIAYYKALGFTHFGIERAEDAIYYFQIAARMEPQKYELSAKKEIAAIYAQLGNKDQAYEILKEVVDILLPANNLPYLELKNEI